MGAGVSTPGEAPADGPLRVDTGRAPERPALSDEAFMNQLAQLRHSLPILPDSVADPGGTWTRSLRSPPAHAAGARGGSAAGPSAPIPHLSTGPLRELVAGYQRYTRWHCRRIVEQQEKLNALIPKAAQQAEWVQQRAAEAHRKMAAAQANLGAVADVRRELEALAERLQRLQRSMGEVERLAAAQRRGGCKAPLPDEETEQRGGTQQPAPANDERQQPAPAKDERPQPAPQHAQQGPEAEQQAEAAEAEQRGERGAEAEGRQRPPDDG